MMKLDERQQVTISREEAAEVMGEAAAAAAAEGDRVRIDVLLASAAEVGVSKEHIDRGIDQLRQRNVERAARMRLARNLLAVTAALVATIALSMLAGGYFATQTLVERAAATERARAFVRQQIDRQTAIEARFAGRTDASDVRAEIEGSINRVAIARRRYDDAAAAYNAAARGFFGRRSVGGALPTRMPFSAEVRVW